MQIVDGLVALCAQ